MLCDNMYQYAFIYFGCGQFDSAKFECKPINDIKEKKVYLPKSKTFLKTVY